MDKCQPLALGVALGALWALYVFLLAVMAMFGWGSDLVMSLSSLYVGYDASAIGAVVGAVWAFIDGLIAGAVIAWVYNKVAK